jgi:hypothetical protein
MRWLTLPQNSSKTQRSETLSQANVRWRLNWGTVLCQNPAGAGGDGDWSYRRTKRESPHLPRTLSPLLWTRHSGRSCIISVNLHQMQFPASIPIIGFGAAHVLQSPERVLDGLWPLPQAECQFFCFDHHILHRVLVVRPVHPTVFNDGFRKLEQLVGLFKGESPFNSQGAPNTA